MALCAALLHTLAFIVSLGIQSTATPLFGYWFFFHVSACAVLLYTGVYPRKKGLVWYACLLWLIAIGVSAFLITPVPGGGAWAAILTAPAIMAMCLRREHIPIYLKCFLTVSIIYALGLIGQWSLQMRFDNYNIGHYAWPLLDPNNAAALINLALIPCFYLMLNKDLRWALPCILFALTFFATGSKAGVATATLCCIGLVTARYGSRWLLLCSILLPIEVLLAYYYRPELLVLTVNSLRDRFPIWQATWSLLWVRPWAGLGLGMFGYYYAQVRTETYTSGWHSHNDLLQLAVEMGIPAMFIFLALILTVALSTSRSNMIAATAMLAVFMQAMVEFQFYIPAIGMPMGLALGYHMLNRELCASRS